jgi:DNA polymerase III sliding clamp (beta) subunit (PCNA family)
MEFIVTTQDLKRALNISTLAVEDSSLIKSHTLFEAKGDTVQCYSTDDDRIAMSSFPAEIDEPFKFTADPKRILSIANSADTDKIKFTYVSESKSVNIYASDTEESFVSLDSFDPLDVMDFWTEFKIMVEGVTVDSSLLISGIKFTQKFIGNKNDPKFGYLFIKDGIMYGTDGALKVGAYSGPSFEKIEKLTLRRTMLSPILSFLDDVGSSVELKITKKKVVLSSMDNKAYFGFRSSTAEPVKLIASMDRPTTAGFNVEKNALSKKVSRLGYTTKEDPGLKLEFSDTELSLSTVTERKSFEKISCKRISGDGPLDFHIGCRVFEFALDTIQTEDIDIFATKGCLLYSKGKILVEEDDKKSVEKSFTAIALLALSRAVK